jgi:DNA-binding NarL/FixJ family response regulator
VIADDHPLTLDGLRGLLMPHFNCVGSVCDGDALVEVALELKPDLIITDILMPGCSGIEAARRIRKQLPEVKLLFFTMHNGAAYLENAFEVGGTGYVLKSAAPEELLSAVRTVLEGGTYLPRSMREQSGTSVQSPSKRNATFCLTRRELEILKLVAQGKSTKDIAFSLGVSVKTVGFHRQNIKKKSGMRTTAEWTKYAIDQFLT